MALDVKTQLLADLQAAVRSGGDRGLTTAQDLRTFLAGLVAALPDAGSTGTGTGSSAGAGSIVLTAPNSLSYLLTVANDGTLHTLLLGAQDPDVLAFSTAAGLTDVAQQQALHTLARALKASGVWPKLRALYPMVGGTARAHALNLLDPRDADDAFRLTFSNNPHHSARGVEWDGQSQSAESHFRPATLPAFSNHLAYYATTDNTSGNIQIEWGCAANGYYSLLQHYDRGPAFDTNGRSVYCAQPTHGLGFGLGSQEDAATATLYRDGLAYPVDHLGGQGNQYPSGTMLLGGRQEGYYSGRACGLASVGEGLTAAEVAAYSAAVAAYQQALGRAVAADPDAAAFSLAAGLTDDGQVRAVGTLVQALKASGVWPKLRACYPMVGGTAQAHALNLKDPRDLDAAFRLTFYNNPTHAAQGVAWDGQSQYADTHFAALGQLGLNSNHLSYYALNDDTSSLQMEMGYGDGTNFFSLLTHFNNYSLNFDSTYRASDGGGQVTAPVSTGQGFSLGTRERADLVSAYRDGQRLASAAVANPTYPSGGTMQLGRRSDGFYSKKACGFASIGEGLTEAEAVALSAAVATYQHALGRAVV